MIQVKELWNDFFFKPQTCKAIAVCRIIAGAVLFVLLLLMQQDLETWYGASNESIISIGTAALCLPSYPTIAFLHWFPSIHFILHALGLASALSLMLGWHTRISAACGFVVLQSFLRRNPFVVSGSDELLSQLLFYLALSRAGDAYSVANMKNVPILASPWAQRLIQIQLCLVYAQTFLSKITHAEWLNGTALYSVLRTRELAHFPLPSFIVQSELICSLLTWATLGLELLLCTLIWYKPLRNCLVVLGIVFHLTMEYCLNIPMFQWVMIACLICFLDEAVFEKIASRFGWQRTAQVASAVEENK